MSSEPYLGKSHPADQLHGPAAHRLPPFHVILLDDNEHTYEYVIDMLRRLFGHNEDMALQLAAMIGREGRVIVDTTTFERAELKRDQIHSFGPDFRLPCCKGPMSAIIKPASC
jgi:ATP-dependent Clp protease adaptor protein ClpS